MAAEHIQVDLNAHEALIIALADIVNTTVTIQTDISSLTSEIPNLSARGYFSYYYGNANSGTSNNGRAKSDGLGDFVRKAQQLSTLAEITHQYAMDAFKRFVDTDRLLAIQVANFMLNDPSVPAEHKRIIKEEPEAALKQIQEQVKGAR